MMTAAAAWWGIAVPLAGCAVVFGTEMLVLFYIWRIIPEREYLPASQSRWSFCFRVQNVIGGSSEKPKSLANTLLILLLESGLLCVWWWLSAGLPLWSGLGLVLLTIPAIRIIPLVHLAREQVRLKARRMLVEMGAPLFVWCGYDLRGSTGDICPECGKGPYPGVLKPSKSLIKT